jgi:hypothetical protein
LLNEPRRRRILIYDTKTKVRTSRRIDKTFLSSVEEQRENSPSSPWGVEGFPDHPLGSRRISRSPLGGVEMIVPPLGWSRDEISKRIENDVSKYFNKKSNADNIFLCFLCKMFFNILHRKLPKE